MYKRENVLIKVVSLVGILCFSSCNIGTSNTSALLSSDSGTSQISGNTQYGTSIDDGSNDNVTANAKIFTVGGTEKIRRDVEYNRNTTTLEYQAVKNEYENAQIIIRPDSNARYTIDLADLESDTGFLLSKDCFTVYHEKYAMVTDACAVSKHEQDLGLGVKGLYQTGEFPDALLPFETAVKYNENVIEANKNQGIWITLRTSKSQKAGHYTGKFTVTVDGVKHKVPVSVDIVNYTLSDNCHVKTAFGLNYNQIGTYENLTKPSEMKDMLLTYREEFFNYRLTTATTPGYITNIPDYIENLKEMVNDVRCTQTSLLWSGVQKVNVNINAQSYICIDGDTPVGTQEINALFFDDIANVIMEVFKASIVSQKDLFSKMAGTFSVFDEADGSSNDTHWKFNSSVYSMRRLVDMTEKMADMFEQTTYSNGVVNFANFIKFDEQNNNAGVGYKLVSGGKNSYSLSTNSTAFNKVKNEFVASLRKYRPIQTLANLNQIYEDYVKITWCPGSYHYQDPDIMQKAHNYAAKAGGEVWIYNAINPSKPYSSYHYNDDLISSRLYTWMMYQKDIVGYLYWATIWQGGVNNKPVYTGIDLYNIPDRYGGRNGDGYLTYPGYVYGIKGFVPSIRLMSIRDANEDYDLLYEIEKSYTGNDFDTRLSQMTESMIDGFKVKYAADWSADQVNADFKEVRKTLCNWANGLKYTENK